MRILHTSDWHLGRLFYGGHLTEDQAYIIEQGWFPLLAEAKVDAVMISGDIFDRAVPPEEAVALWNDVLTRLHQDFTMPLYVIGGNHDSGERLACGRALWSQSGYHVEGQVRSKIAPWTLEKDGEVVHICPFPYAEPHQIITALGQTNTAGFGDTLAGWAQYYSDSLQDSYPRIAMGHAFVIGGETSESERPLSVGGTDAVSADIFKDFQYTALGHLHRPQSIGDVRYSGSLLKYSFDESKHQKSMTIIDMQANGLYQLETVSLTPRRDVRVVRGSFAEVLEGRVYQEQVAQGLSLEDYLLVELTDAAPVIDAMARLRRVYPHVLAINPVGRLVEFTESEMPQFRELDGEQLFAAFAEMVQGSPLSEEEAKYVATVWQAAREEES